MLYVYICTYNIVHLLLNVEIYRQFMYIHMYNKSNIQSARGHQIYLNINKTLNNIIHNLTPDQFNVIFDSDNGNSKDDFC